MNPTKAVSFAGTEADGKVAMRAPGITIPPSMRVRSGDQLTPSTVLVVEGRESDGSSLGKYAVELVTAEPATSQGQMWSVSYLGAEKRLLGQFLKTAFAQAGLEPLLHVCPGKSKKCTGSAVNSARLILHASSYEVMDPAFPPAWLPESMPPREPQGGFRAWCC